MSLLAAIETGGTKILAAVGTSPLEVALECRLETGCDPAAIIAELVRFFKSAEDRFGRIGALGIGSFGPLERRRDLPRWGYVLSSVKPGWEEVDFAGPLARALDVPVAFETDVTAAAVGEARYGAGRGLSDFVYLTVGTGIGGGAVVGGAPLTGLAHPEMGHVRPRLLPDDNFAGVCPIHGNCLEGLISGPAIEARAGCRFDELPGDHPVRQLVARYLGEYCAELALVLSPGRIIIGGGVMAGSELHDAVAEAMCSALGGYMPRISGRSGYICAPGLGDRAGLIGALALAADLTAGDDS